MVEKLLERKDIEYKQSEIVLKKFCRLNKGNLGWETFDFGNKELFIMLALILQNLVKIFCELNLFQKMGIIYEVYKEKGIGPSRGKS